MTRRNRSFQFNFEQLYLINEAGKQALPADGRAEICYTNDVSDFSIEDIELDAWAGSKACRVPAEGWVETAIRAQVETGKWADQVMDKIRDQIEGDREYRADHRRDQMMEMGR